MKMAELTFSEGYKTFISNSGAAVGADAGAAYVGNVEAEIAKLTDAINNSVRRIDNVDVGYVKGFIAEQWFARTLNIDSVVKDLPDRAAAVDDNGLVDIITNWGADYQAKISKNPEWTARILAITNEGKSKASGLEYSGDADPRAMYYDGQYGLVATDKIDAIRDVLQREIARNKDIRPDIAENYQKALDNLTDRIKSDGGAESIPLTEQESRLLAQLAKDKGFDPEEWGLRTEELIRFENLMSQAFKAGLTAALLSVLLKLAPEICGIIAKLIKDGEVDAREFKRIGFEAVKGGGEGFIRGSVTAAITIACKQGLLGEALKKADPFAIGAITVFALNTVKNACLMSFGKIDKHEFAERCMRDLVITACAYGLGKAGAAIAATLFTPAAALVGYLIGSFVGSVIGSFIYKGAYACVISFCIDSGCTFFGLVEQDYVLPDDVLRTIGTKVFDYDKVKPLEFKPKTFEFKQFAHKQFEPLEIDISFLRRGVIAVGVIGYE
jgi:hypothetical protein